MADAGERKAQAQKDSELNATTFNTRQRILAAAERALIEGGPGQLRVDRVAAQAGANKRMIYHYFGDRNGLVIAVLRLQHERLRTAGPVLSAGTQATLAAMMRSAELLGPQVVTEAKPEPAAQPTEASVDPLRLQSAARILLPYLMQAQTDIDSGEVTPTQWVSFCVEMLSLAFASSAPVAFPHPPGSLEFKQVSERLLSQKKPRYRLHSDTRRNTARDE